MECKKLSEKGKERIGKVLYEYEVEVLKKEEIKINEEKKEDEEKSNVEKVENEKKGEDEGKLLKLVEF